MSALGESLAADYANIDYMDWEGSAKIWFFMIWALLPDCSCSSVNVFSSYCCYYHVIYHFALDYVELQAIL